MKKSLTGVFLVWIIIFFSSGLLAAQKPKLGVKGGYNSSNVILKNFSDYELSSGIHLGFLGHFTISSKLAVQSELLLNNQGGRLQFYKIKLLYTSIPLLVQLVNKNFIIQSGPQLGILLSAKHKNISFETTETNMYRLFEVSWIIGAAYIITHGLGIDGRYLFGITNIRKPGYEEATNRVIQIGIFYRFQGGVQKK